MFGCLDYSNSCNYTTTIRRYSIFPFTHESLVLAISTNVIITKCHVMWQWSALYKCILMIYQATGIKKCFASWNARIDDDHLSVLPQGLSANFNILVMDSLNNTSSSLSPNVPNEFQKELFGPEVKVVQYIITATGGVASGHSINKKNGLTLSLDVCLGSATRLRQYIQDAISAPYIAPCNCVHCVKVCSSYTHLVKICSYQIKIKAEHDVSHYVGRMVCWYVLIFF
jgi:hypothetical protein